MIFWKRNRKFYFFDFLPKGGPFGVETVKMVFFNFSKFHNFFSQNSFTGTKQILKQTKSWILVTPVIKLWKCQTILGCLGPKGPPSVGIGLIGTPEYLIRVFSATFPPIFRNVGGAISPLSRSSIPAHTYITTQDHNNCNHSTRCSRHHLNSNQFKCKFENSTEFDEKLVKV